MNKHKIGLILSQYKYNNLNEHGAIKKIFGEFGVCLCGDKNPIKPGVPWGAPECAKCRIKTGNCKICEVNRNDCSC